MPRPTHPLVRIVRAIFRPAHTVSAFWLRVEICLLRIINRFTKSPVATGKPGAVVSLTTYGKRIRSVHLTIESIARGQVLPSRLILWLDDVEVFAHLPPTLRRLEARGLEIRLSKNYGPHTKYYPFLQEQEEFAAPLVTADDDVIYPRTWLAGLAQAHERYPNFVNCYRARVVTIRDWKIAPYREWYLCRSTEPSLRAMATGVSGVIYPIGLLRELKRAGTGFEMCCPKADDLWLHVQAIRSGVSIKQIQSKALLFPHIPGTQDVALWSENWEKGAEGNDRQSAVTYQDSDLAMLDRGSGIHAI
jgi:hypothetical protein